MRRTAVGHCHNESCVKVRFHDESLLCSSWHTPSCVLAAPKCMPDTCCTWCCLQAFGISTKDALLSELKHQMAAAAPVEVAA